MGKIKAFFSNQIKDLEKLFKNYMISIISGMLLSVFVCVNNGYDYNETPIALEYIMIFLVIFTVGAILLETLYVTVEGVRNNRALLVGGLVNIFLSVVWTIIVRHSEKAGRFLEFMGSEDIGETIVVKLFFVYMMIICGVAIYRMIKKNGLDFDHYIARVIFGFLKVWAVYFVLIFAIEALFSIFDSLIFEIDYWEISEYIMILLAGFLFYPYTLMTITNTKDDNSKFTKGFINFLCLPAIYIAMIIVYMYVVKIIVTGEMPSNEVFDICAYVFLFGMPSWFMSYGFLRQKDQEKGQVSRYTTFVKHIKYAYIPLLILEIISMGIRIANYGLTESRYMAVVLIISQTIYLGWELIGKLLKKNLGYENYIFVAMTIVIIVLICPVINIDKLCFISQRDRFEKALEAGDYYTAESSYDVLRYSDYGEVYIDQKYTSSEKSELENLLIDYADYDYSYYEYVRYYVEYNTKESIKVEGYSDIYMFDFYMNELTSEDVKDITIEFGTNQEVVVDLTEAIEHFRLLDEGGNNTSYIDYYYLSLGPNCCLVIDDINFSYMMQQNQYKYKGLNIQGYVLINNGGHNGQ